MSRINKNWPELQKFQSEHKELLVIIADPKTDEMSVSFMDRFGFVRFPSKDFMDGVIFNALRQSKFDEAIDPFMAGVVECTGIKVKTKAGNEVLNAIGGAMRSIGRPKAEDRSKFEVLSKSDKKKK